MPDPVDVELAFVLGRSQNAFFVELAEALHSELRAQGVASSLHTGPLPAPAPERVYVILPPHEYAVVEGGHQLGDDAVLARTITISAEQPASEWFGGNLTWVQRAGAAFDINPRGVEAYRSHGVAARLLALGHVPAWDTSGPGWDDGRDIDVLFLGSLTAHREAVLAACGRVLDGHRSHIVLSDNSRPNTGTNRNFVAGADKWALLRRARVLLNVHRADEPYSEWLRLTESIHAGAVVVSEASTGLWPLVAGEHLFVGRADSLPWVLEAALDDDDRLRRVRRDALDHLRERPLAAAARDLADAARTLLRRPVPVVAPARPHSPFAPAAPSEDAGDAGLAAVVKSLRLELMDLRRQLDRHVLRPRSDPEGDATGSETRLVTRTPAWSDARADITVITAVHNDGAVACEALSSAMSSIGVRLEVVLVDDGSRDDSAAVVARWLDAHPRLPAVLVQHTVNRGLGSARNTALDLARAPWVFVLDADNTVYPHGLAALLEAATTQGPAFTYGLLECFDHTGPTHLLSVMDWEPARLRRGNYIDAMALISTAALREAGGYTRDLRLHGWEDYDLWCRFASTGLSGALVRTVVGRYHQSGTSMRSITDIDHREAMAVLRVRHPLLFRDAGEVA